MLVDKGSLLFILDGSFAIMMIVFGTHKLRQFVNYVFSFMGKASLQGCCYVWRLIQIFDVPRTRSY